MEDLIDTTHSRHYELYRSVLFFYWSILFILASHWSMFLIFSCFLLVNEQSYFRKDRLKMMGFEEKSKDGKPSSFAETYTMRRESHLAR